MRDALAPLEGARLTVTAAVVRHSQCVGWGGIRQPTILLGCLTTPDGAVLTDHLWFRVGKRLADADLHAGDRVQFTGRVARYQRRRSQTPGAPRCASTDYHLIYPTNVQVLVRVARSTIEPAIPPASVMPEDETPAARRAASRARIQRAIVELTQEQREPPSMGRILGRAQVAPSNLIATLSSLAKAGVIYFRPDGSIIPIHRPAHGGAS